MSGSDPIQEAMGDGFRAEFCDYCKRNLPNAELTIIYTIYNDIQAREYVCEDCEDEARHYEAPAGESA